MKYLRASVKSEKRKTQGHHLGKCYGLVEVRVKGARRKQKREIKVVGGEPGVSSVTETKGVKC